jgi:hypothetical protein
MSSANKNEIKELIYEIARETASSRSLYEEIKTLKDDRVWITKKARMEAEARMNRNNFLSQILVNYYTFGVLAFSIWTLVSQNNYMSLLTVVASVGLFGMSIFVSAIGYREKALQYKESYLNLSELEFELKNLLRNKEMKDPEIVAELDKLEKRYTEILSKSDNHIDSDFIKVLLKHDKKVSQGDLIKYYLKRMGFYFFTTVLIAAPILLSFIYIGGIK